MVNYNSILFPDFCAVHTNANSKGNDDISMIIVLKYRQSFSIQSVARPGSLITADILRHYMK